MLPPDWLTPSRVALGVSADGLAGVTAKAAELLRTEPDLADVDVARALRDTARSSDFSIGSGIAVPHVEIPHLARTVVALVRLETPIELGALDRQPVDLFFVVLFGPGDPRAHLLLLAHLARLGQSRTLREGLRRAETPDDAIQIIQAAEARHPTAPLAVPETPPAKAERPKPASSTPSLGLEGYLCIISVSGERAVDAALVELLDLELGDSLLLEVQTVREAASREVPLFAAFRDIFGDPGGARLILCAVPGDKVETLSSTVRRVCAERGAERADMSFVPIALRWSWTKPRRES